jgi:hypothetical protein
VTFTLYLTNEFTSQLTVLLEEMVLPQVAEKFPSEELVGLLSCSQESASGLLPDPVESSPHVHILVLSKQMQAVIVQPSVLETAGNSFYGRSCICKFAINVEYCI